MKNLLLVTALVALGYFLVTKGCDSTTPPPAPPAEPVAKKEEQDPTIVAAGNDFFIYTRVMKMYRDWKERSLGTPRSQPPGARNEDLSILLTEIRDRLGERPYKLHKMETVEEVILVSLGLPHRELDVPPSQRQHVLAGILSEAAKDGQKGSLGISE